MVYYNRQHEKFEPIDMKYLDEGECVEVFCDGKMIFKKYFSNTDPDLFEIKTNSKKYISENNKKELLDLFSSIFRNAALNTFARNRVRNFLFDEIDKINVTSDTSVTYEISKKLKHVKKPIELFKR